MSSKIFLAVLCLFIALSPVKVQASEVKDKAVVCFLCLDYEGDYLKSDVTLEFMSKFSTAQIAYMAFYNLFYNTPEDCVKVIPRDTELISVSLVNGRIIVNVTEDILNYSGSHTERAIIMQITNTAFSIKDVNAVSLYVNNELAILPEGSIINKQKSED